MLRQEHTPFVRLLINLNELFLVLCLHVTFGNRAILVGIDSSTHYTYVFLYEAATFQLDSIIDWLSTGLKRWFGWQPGQQCTEGF
jgi:hypothetical protein